MIAEFKKSIQSILYERITSPLSGAFTLSWLLWNWKLFYFIFFVDANLAINDRFNYINSNFINIYFNLIYPIFSTIFLILIYPFISTGVLWVWLKFRKWQNEIKNSIESSQLLSLEKSLELRAELQNQINKFNGLLKSKEDEIDFMNKEIRILNEKLFELQSNTETVMSSKTKETESPDLLYEKDFQILLNDAEIIDYMPMVIERTTRGAYLPETLPRHVLSKLVLNDIIIKSTSDRRLFEITEKGKLFFKEYLRNHPQQF